MTTDRSLAPVAAPDRWRRLLLATACTVGFLTLLVSLSFVLGAGVDPALRFDTVVIQAGTAWSREHPVLLRALLVWQELLQPWLVYLAASLVCLSVGRPHRMTSRAVWAFVTMMVCWNVAFDLKLLVQRDRPVVESPLTVASGYSFPSGHAAGSAAAATALLVLLWPLLTSWGRCAGVTTAVVVIAVTGADRVLLGVHYPSDVLAGVVLGVGMVLASWAGYHRGLRDVRRWPRRDNLG